MSDDRLYRQAVYLGIAYPEAFADPYNPTAAELNNGDLVFDVTCALWEDGTEFTLGDSDTDDGLTFCSNSGDTTLTTKNATVVYKALRDQDRSASGLFNLAFDLLAFPDITLFAVERIGFPNTTAFAAGQKVRLVQVTTDNPVDVLAVDASLFLQSTLLQNDTVAWNVTVA